MQEIDALGEKGFWLFMMDGWRVFLCVCVCVRVVRLIQKAVPLVDPQRSHFCEQLGGERLPKKREEMRGERRGRRGGFLETMGRIIGHTGPGLAPGNVDAYVCVLHVLETRGGRILKQ